MSKIVTLGLREIIRSSEPLSSANSCRFHIGGDLNHYISPVQAIILSHLSLRDRKLSLPEEIIMKDCPTILFYDKGNKCGVREKAIESKYEFAW